MCDLGLSVLNLNVAVPASFVSKSTLSPLSRFHPLTKSADRVCTGRLLYFFLLIYVSTPFETMSLRKYFLLRVLTM